MKHLVGKNKFLRLEEVSYGFQNKLLAEKINLSLYEGEIVVLSGHNGSGKSTLARLLLGVQKPLKGKIQSFFSKKAYVPQKSEIDVSYPITLYEFIELSLVQSHFIWPFKKNYDVHKIFWAMTELEIWQKRHTSFSKASGGEIQRCLIARALAMEPDFLVLDEPYANLDKKGRLKLTQLLLDLNQKQKTTIFIIDHHQVFPRGIVKHYLLENGKLIYDRKSF